MIYTASTLGQLRDAVNSLIEAIGEDAPVGCFCGPVDLQQGDHIDGDVILEWVCITEADGQIVGTEAEDYERQLQPGEVNAIAIR
jgi:hypothetical protein